MKTLADFSFTLTREQAENLCSFLRAYNFHKYDEGSDILRIHRTNGSIYACDVEDPEDWIEIKEADQ